MIMENQESKIIEVNGQEPAPEAKAKSAQDYFRKGLDDAAAKAKQYAPEVKKELEGLMQEVAYGAGFVPGFVGTLVKEFLPEKMNEYVEKGVSKGEQNAQDLAKKVKKASCSPESPETSAESPQAS